MKNIAKPSNILRKCIRNAALVGVALHLFGQGGPSIYANPAASGIPPMQHGALGSTTDFRSKSELFGFFHFTPTGKTVGADGKTVESFKPAGEAFRALVTLYVTSDTTGSIQRLRLVVARSFIDDPTKGIFAGDLVKSFLGNAATNSEDDNVTKLAREIDARSLMSGARVFSARPLPKAPERPSAAYLTYAGKGATQTLLNRPGSIQVWLENGTEAGTPVLEVTEGLVEWPE